MGSPALRGTGILVLGFIGLASAPSEPDPVADRVVRLDGEVARTGWYEADDLAAAVRAAGGTPPTMASGAVEDGATVRIVGDWALPARRPEAAPTRALASRRARVSLNGASRAELEALPRVGPAMAARIEAGRPYRSLADLDRVKGVGPATMALLAPLVEP